MYGACIFYNNYLKGVQCNDFNYICFWKKKPNKKNIKISNGGFFYYYLKCNNLEEMILSIHSF